MKIIGQIIKTEVRQGSIKFGKETFDKDYEYVTLVLSFKLNNIPLLIEAEFTVFDEDDKEDIILGLDTLKKYGLLSYIGDPEKWARLKLEVAPEENTFEPAHAIYLREEKYSYEDVDINPDFPLLKELKEIVKKHKKIFDPMCNLDCVTGVSDFVLKLKPNVELPKVKPRRHAPAVEAKIKEEIEKYIALGIMQPSTSHVASQLVPVVKTDGTIRLCTNYPKVNQVTVIICYPVANFNDTISRIAGKEYYGLLDGVRTYNQFRIHPLSRYLTAFVCLLGLFEFVK